jgi:hypothetical protein
MVPKLSFRRALWTDEQINDSFCWGNVGICFEDPFFGSSPVGADLIEMWT